MQPAASAAGGTQYALETPSLPSLSMVEQYRHPRQTPCHTSATHAHPIVTVSPPLPTESQRLPPFAASFHTPFISAHSPQQLAPQPFVTLLSNKSTPTPTPFSHTAQVPIQLPVLTNVPTAQYHPEPPLINPAPPTVSPPDQSLAASFPNTSAHPTNEPVLASLPAITSPPAPLQYVTLPATSNPFPLTVRSPTVPKATPSAPAVAAGKTHRKQRKQSSSTKRARAKKSSTNAPRNALAMPADVTSSRRSVPDIPSVAGDQATPARGHTTRRPVVTVPQRDATVLPTEPRQTGSPPPSRRPPVRRSKKVVMCAKSATQLPVSKKHKRFAAPKPRPERSGLNFADTAHQKSTYFADCTLPSLSPWSDTLQARERVTSRVDPVTRGEDPQLFNGATDVPGAGGNEKPHLATPLDFGKAPGCSIAPGAAPLDSLEDPSEQDSIIPVRGRPRKRRRGASDVVKGGKRGSLNSYSGNPNRVSCQRAATVLPVSTAVPQNVQKIGEPNVSMAGYQKISNFMRSYRGVSDAASEWGGEAERESGGRTLGGTRSDFVVQALGTAGKGRSSGSAPYSQENMRKESAAECLTTVARSFPVHETDSRRDETRRRTNVGHRGASNTNGAGEGGAMRASWNEHMNSKSKNGEHLKGLHSRQGNKDAGDCGMQIDNNFGNFLCKHNAQNLDYQLTRPNQSQPTYTPSIPAIHPSALPETPQPAQHCPASAAMLSQAASPECAKSTPVDTRDTLEMFTRPSQLSPQVSRNLSYLPGTGSCLQPPPAQSQPHERTIHCPAQVVRPLFPEQDCVQSSPDTSQAHQPFVVPHHQTNHSDHYQPINQPATSAPTFQIPYPIHTSSNLPANHQLHGRASTPPQPLAGAAFHRPQTVLKQGSRPQADKRPFENPATHEYDTASKPMKPVQPTSKRSSANTAKQKRPRPPKKPRSTPQLATILPGSTVAAVSPTNTAPLEEVPSLPTPQSNGNMPAAPLRLRTNFTTDAGTAPATAKSLHPSDGHSDQHPTQQQASDETQASITPLHDILAPWPAQAAQAGIPVVKPGWVNARDVAPVPSKRTQPIIHRPLKTKTKNRSATDNALKTTEKADQSKQSALSLAKKTVASSPRSQEPGQAANLSAPMPLAPLRTACQPTSEVQLDFATSVQQNRPQEAFESHLRADGSAGTLGDVKDHAQGRRPSERKAQTAIALTRPLHVSTEPNGQGHGATSPRTESTQQTLPVDTPSVGPSDIENPSESDDIPLAQTIKHVRDSSLTTRRTPDAKAKAVAAQTQSQGEGEEVFRRQLSTVSREMQTCPASRCTSLPGTQVPAGEKPPFSSRKRQTSSKVKDSNKRKKRNLANFSEQKLSTGRKGLQKAKYVVPVSEQTAEDAVVRCQQDSLPELKNKVSPKKTVKEQARSKIGRQTTYVRKRQSSSTKTLAKERSKRNPSQLNLPTVRPTANGASNLRLSLSVQEKDSGTAQATETKPSEDACGSPITPERHSNGFRYTSKSPQGTKSREGKESDKAGSNFSDKKPQATPCFEEELRNLRTSGIIHTSEEISSLSSSESLRCVTDTQNVLCILCQMHRPRDEMVKHPCFPVRAFDVCKTCSQIISKRVEEHGSRRKKAAICNKQSVTQRTTLFVMLIEAMVTHFSPSDRELRDIQQIYEFISTRNWTEMAERAESLSINLEMLTVLRVALRKIGFSVRGGKLRWPAGEFALPTLADARALVSHAIPARIDDLRKGILPGEAAWKETFGESDNLSAQGSSCAMYEKLFGLIGLKLVHAKNCNAGNDSTGTCKVKFEAVSIGVLMYRTSAMLSGTVTQELLAACWTKEEAFRFIDETEIELLNESFDGAPKSCCICGDSEKFREHSCSFRFSNCIECLKSFCSICLLNVLGASEYLRSFGEGGYCCMMCRFRKNADLCPSGKPNSGERDRRLRLHNLGGIKKRTDRRVRSMPPLLLLSPSVRADILLRLESPEAQKALGVAKFCEVVNDNSIRNAMDAQGVQDSHDICLGCKLPVDFAKQDGFEGDVLGCGHENCVNVMHKNCTAPQRQARRRGSRAKWTCPHHQCNKCEQRDESKLLRCRTCPVAYCKEHMSLPSEVYLFSDKSFACSTCRSFLQVPQMLRLKSQGSKSERKKNQITQALAIDQRKRSAAVKKLSESPGCHEVASSFTEFRRELEIK